MNEAAALRYFAEVGVPVLTAKGVGEAAHRLIALAEKLGVPVVDHPAASALVHLQEGRPIDMPLMSAMAEIYGALVALDASFETRLAPPPPNGLSRSPHG